MLSPFRLFRHGWLKRNALSETIIRTRAAAATPQLTGLTNAEVQDLVRSADASTKDFFVQQTMYRIKDPRKSVPFYTGVLGMQLLQKLDFADGQFSIYYMGYECATDIPCAEKERSRWAMTRKATLELTHNWGTECDCAQKYHSGNEEPRGFGHMGIYVPDVDKACERFEQLKVEFKKRPHERRMRGLAFIKDPDGYWIEIFNDKILDL